MNYIIPYGKQEITPDDIRAVNDVLVSDFLTQGPKVAEFETAFAKYIGSKYAVAVSNGTAALHLCALALNVNSKSKVITTPITFVASANCIRYCNGEVVFADTDENALLDIKQVEKILKNSPKGMYCGIIPVDFTGRSSDLEAFRELAGKYDLWIVEDACHAPGGYFTDKNGIRQHCGNGTFSDLSIFSFHPVKHITSGEGGMITTNNKKLYNDLLALRTHGITKNKKSMEEQGGWYYEMSELGYNYRLTDIQAALGISQLKRAKENFIKRKEIALKYNESFKNSNIKTPELDEGHAYHLYVIRVKDRKGLYNFLRSHNIFVQVHYIPVHLQPYYKNLGSKKGDFPIAEKYYDECLSLPMYPTLSKEEQQYVINKVIEYCEK